MITGRQLSLSLYTVSLHPHTKPCSVALHCVSQCISTASHGANEQTVQRQCSQCFTESRPDSILCQFGETARCRDAQRGDGVCCALAPQLVLIFTSTIVLPYPCNCNSVSSQCTFLRKFALVIYFAINFHCHRLYLKPKMMRLHIQLLVIKRQHFYF